MADRPAESAPPARGGTGKPGPEPRGQVLASLLRGKDERLQVTLDEYEGHPFLSIRVWARTRTGQWVPVKGKGVSVRVRELGDVASAIAEASTILKWDGPRPERNSGPRAGTAKTTPLAATSGGSTPAPGWAQPSDGDELPF